MERIPVATGEASLAEPDPLVAVPPGAVAVRLTVRNVGPHALRVRSNQTELELADGRRLDTSRPPRPPVEAPTVSMSARGLAEPGSSSKPAPSSEPTTSASKEETATKTVVDAVALAGATAIRTAGVVFMPVLVVAAVATSPIWGPFALVALHEERESLRAALDAGLQAGDVDLAAGESASAVIEFVAGDVAGAGSRAAFVVVRVTDDVGRDWTARLPVVSPK
jgi:hypothetical protein